MRYDAAENSRQKYQRYLKYAAQMNSRKRYAAQIQEVWSDHSPLMALATRKVT